MIERRQSRPWSRRRNAGLHATDVDGMLAMLPKNQHEPGP